MAFAVFPYWVAFIVLLRIDTGAGGAIRRHRLISILPKVEDILFLIIVYAFYHLWSDQRAFCDDSFH